MNELLHTLVLSVGMVEQLASVLKFLAASGIVVSCVVNTAGLMICRIACEEILIAHIII